MREKRFILFLFLALFTYLVLRAIFVPMLHDEIATFFRYVHINEVFPWLSEWSANNHYLNSLLTLFSYKTFGSSPIALRLANLIFFPLYFYYSWRICGLLKNSWLKYGLLISLLSVHNFLEFFATSRGYGISMALMMGSIWYTMLAIKEPKLKYTFYALGLLVLATYANLTIMNSFLLVTGLLSLTLVTKTITRGFLSQLAFILFIGIIPIVFFIRLLFRLQAEGELHYGKPDGFVSVSMTTIGKLLTGTHSKAAVIIPMILFAIAGIIFLLKAWKQIKSKDYKAVLSFEWVFIYLLAGNVIASVLENRLFGTNYPEDRTGLYFYPLLAGSLFFSLDKIRFNRNWLSLIPAVPFVFFPFHFVTHANITWSSLENQAIPKRFHEYVGKDMNASGFQATVQGYQGRLMRWAYMNFRTGSELNLVHFSGYPSLDGDFQIVFLDDYPTWSDYYDLIDKDQRSGLSLLERKVKLQRDLVFQKKEIGTDGVNSAEFFELSRGAIDSLAGNTLYTGFEFELASFNKPFHGWVVTSVNDTDGQVIRYEFLPLDWYRTDWSVPGKPIRNGMLIQNLPGNASSYVSYIWNIRKVPFEIKNGELVLFKIRRDYDVVNKNLMTKRSY